MMDKWNTNVRYSECGAKGVLTLPENFTFELEITNPFFTEDGSGSVPISIPASPENLATLGYPSRLGGTSPTIKSFPAILSHGIFHTKGELIFDSLINYLVV